VVDDHLEDGGDAIVVIEAEAVSVGGQDQKQVEALLVRGERAEEPLAQEAMGQEGEALAANASDAVGQDGGTALGSEGHVALTCRSGWARAAKGLRCARCGTDGAAG